MNTLSELLDLEDMEPEVASGVHRCASLALDACDDLVQALLQVCGENDHGKASTSQVLFAIGLVRRREQLTR